MTRETPADSKPAATWEPIDSLTPWDRNPRRNASAVDAVAKSIERFGFSSPIVARQSDRVVIAGHTRLLAAQQLKLDKVPVRFIDIDPAEAAALALADNRTGEIAEWDDAALADLLREMDEDSRQGLGWSDAELDMITAGAGSVDGDDWGAALGALPEGDRGPIQTMTFTLHDDQVEVVKAALEAARKMGPFVDTGNENGNGNALARVCEFFRG